MNNQLQYSKVSSKEELLEKMNEREHYILVDENLKQEVIKLLNTTLSDEELMGAELGSAGSIGLFSEVLYQIFNFFSGKSKIDRRLESSIRQYRHKMKDREVLLYHKQLDY